MFGHTSTIPGKVPRMGRGISDPFQSLYPATSLRREEKDVAIGQKSHAVGVDVLTYQGYSLTHPRSDFYLTEYLVSVPGDEPSPDMGHDAVGTELLSHP